MLPLAAVYLFLDVVLVCKFCYFAILSNLSFLKSSFSHKTFKCILALNISYDTSLAKNLKVQVKNLPFHNMTLEEYTNSQINLLEEKLLESNTTILSDIPGYKIVFTNIEGLKTMQVWTIKDDKAYIITYVAQEEDYEKELQIAQKMIDSFEIK
jgi:hypothetical protein